MSVEERDVWRSPDGRYRLVARVWDSSAGLRTDYTAQVYEFARWRPVVEAGEALAVAASLARQLDRDAREERAR